VKKKGIAMTTGFNMSQRYVNFIDSEFISAHGWPIQLAVRCRKQALYLQFLLAGLILFLDLKEKGKPCH